MGHIKTVYSAYEVKIKHIFSTLNIIFTILFQYLPLAFWQFYKSIHPKPFIFLGKELI